MIFCYFNNDESKTYNCEFYIENNELFIKVDFGNPSPQLLAEIYNSRTPKYSVLPFDTISIVDRHNKLYYKTFNAVEISTSTSTGRNTRLERTYVTDYYLKSNDEASLLLIKPTSLIKSISCSHECLDVNYKNKAYNITYNDNFTKTTITLDDNEQNTSILNITNSFIKKATINGTFSYTNNFYSNININYTNELIIELAEKTSFYDIFQYHKLISMMFNLFYKNEIPVYKFKIFTSECAMELVYKNMYYKPTFSINQNLQPTNDIQLFLENFFNVFQPNEISFNLLYPFIHDGHISTENNFLNFYRFIETYQKPRTNGGWLEKTIENNCGILQKSKVIHDENTYLVMINLRNHFAHDGYYIPDNKLCVNNIDVNITSSDIIAMTHILKILSYKIIFNDILKLNLTDNKILYIS